ncbi:MAG TPA: serine protease [Candidatus Paceibacterota bacterium]|nr:serine protease [Candidatus Paceibacterota bacterium]
MKAHILAIAALLLLGSFAQAAEPACQSTLFPALVRSVVSIERMFDADEVQIENGKTIYGIRGVAWWLAPRMLVTIEHVATASKLNDDWKKVTLSWGDTKDGPASHSFETKARFKELVPGDQKLEYLALLEVENEPPGAVSASVRATPLRNGEPVIGVGYKDQKLRFAEGRLIFPKFSEEGPQVAVVPLPYLPFELYDSDLSKNDRYVFDHGASGSPLFDCNGEAVAVTQGLQTSTLTFFQGQSIRVTTPWGTANESGISTASLATVQWNMMHNPRRSRPK